MSLTVDASSPSAARGSGATTSPAAFTPPGACLLVAYCQGDANNGSLDEDQTVTDTLSNTWTKKVLHNANGGAVATVHYLRITGSSPGSITASLADNKGSVAKSIYPRVYTDPATGIAPDIGATGVSATASVSLTTTVNNSWVWSCGLTANATLTAGSGCTLQDETGGFDTGDAVFTQSQTSTTPTAGTLVTNAISGTATVPHNIAIEIIPGGGETNYAGPWTGPTPGRIGPTGQWAPAPVDTSSAAAAIVLGDAGASAEAVAVTATASLTTTGTSAETLTTTATAQLADAGSTAEALSATATVALADVGSATDTLVAGIAISPGDTGAGGDTLGVAAAVSLADAGTAAQSLTVTAVAAVADAGSAADTMTVVVTLALADTGHAAEAATVTAAVGLTDTGAGADTATGVNSGGASKSLADGGAATEVLCVCKLQLRPNTGTVARPSTGTTARPNTGTVGPCGC